MKDWRHGERKVVGHRGKKAKEKGYRSVLGDLGLQIFANNEKQIEKGDKFERKYTTSVDNGLHRILTCPQKDFSVTFWGYAHR